MWELLEWEIVERLEGDGDIQGSSPLGKLRVV
jgi:hypothetical protein